MSAEKFSNKCSLVGFCSEYCGELTFEKLYQDEWYPIVNKTSGQSGMSKLRLQCCRIPHSVAAARCAYM